MKKNISYKRKSKSKQNLKYKGGGRWSNKIGHGFFNGLRKIEQLDEAVKAKVRGKPSSEENNTEAEENNTEAEENKEEEEENKEEEEENKPEGENKEEEKSKKPTKSKASKGMDMMKKAMSSGMSSSMIKKAPFNMLLDLVVYTLYTVAGALIYYPSFIVNFPNTTLEHIIPTEGGCKTIFGNELICKRKIKCFLKQCSLLEDPVGERIRAEEDKIYKHNRRKFQLNKSKKNKLYGGNKKNKTNKSKLHPYMKYFPKHIRNKIIKHNLNEIKKYLKLKRRVEKDQKGGNNQMQVSSTESAAKAANNIVKRLQGEEQPEEEEENKPEGEEEEEENKPEGQEQPEEEEENKPEGVKVKKNGMMTRMAKSAATSAKKAVQNISLSSGPIKTDTNSPLNPGTCVNINNKVLCDNNKRVDYNTNKGHDFITRLVGVTDNDVQQHIMVNNMYDIFTKLFSATSRQQGGKKNRKKGKKRKKKMYGGSQQGNSVDHIQTKLIEILSQILDAKSTIDGTSSSSSRSGSGVSVNTSVANNSYSADVLDIDLVSDFIEQHLDQDTVYRLLIAYIMFEKLFNTPQDKSAIAQKQGMNPGSNLELGVDVTFPWTTKDPFLSPEERRKCLFMHLTKTSVEPDDISPELYKKCFICKNCTLINTSYSVWNNLFNNLFTNVSSDMKRMANDMYKILSKSIEYNRMEPKRYYIVSLMSMNLLCDLFDPTMLETQYNVDQIPYTLRDLILGIPYMKPTQFTPSEPIKQKLQSVFAIMKTMELKKLLYKLCFSRIFKNIINAKTKEQRLHHIKKIIDNRMNMFYNGSFEITDGNDINLQDITPYDIYNLSAELKKMENKKSTEEYANKQISDLVQKALEHAKFKKLFNNLLSAHYEDKTLYDDDFQNAIEKLNKNSILNTTTPNKNTQNNDQAKQHDIFSKIKKKFSKK